MSCVDLGEQQVAGIGGEHRVLERIGAVADEETSECTGPQSTQMFKWNLGHRSFVTNSRYTQCQLSCTGDGRNLVIAFLNPDGVVIVEVDGGAE